MKWMFLLYSGLMVLWAGGAAADPYIDEVVSVVPGSNQLTGFTETSAVLGGPEGNPGGSLHVYNLGVGGEIIVRFHEPVIYNGTGTDFTVFENPFYTTTSDFPQGSVFLETGTVAVSSDGGFFLEFPTDYLASGEIPSGTTGDASPARYVGFAGVQPVFANSSNGIDPTDPAVSGGDLFDLEDLVGLPGAENVDFDNIRYIRIRDTGENPVDSDGDPVPDPYSGLGTFDNGFDLDAIAVVNGKPDSDLTPVSSDLWKSYR